MRAIRHLWPWIKPYRIDAVVSFAATVATVLINLSIPLLTARIIDDGIGPSDSSVVLRTGVVMVALILAGMAASAVSSAFGVRLAFHTVTDLRRDVFSRTQDLSFADLDSLSSGEILTRITSDMTRVNQLLAMGISFMAQIPIMFVGALLAIVSIDLSLVIIIAVMLPVIGVIVSVTIVRSNALYDAVQSRIDRLNTVVQEMIQGAELVKAFVRQDHEVERFDRAADDLADQSIQVNQLVAALFPTLIVISSLGIAAVLWLGGASVIAGDLTQGELVAFLSYMALITFPMMMFAFMQPTISAATASIIRIDEILQIEPAVPAPAQGLSLDTVETPGEVEFEAVSFGYASASDADDGHALTDIDLRIRAGSMVAILGATGSGKSSLVHLIPRFYDATTGTVRVGGVDVRALSKDSLRSHIGIALQQPQLFSGTVMDNLRFAAPDATDEQIEEACRAAQAHDFIVAMPQGYDSTVEQSGANLSGGQRQRLTIARTLLSAPSILILDDSTSAVDLETEAQIQNALAELDVTVIIVAQRISTALGADEIVVLDEGRIAAHGTHDELLASSPIYHDIYRSQLGEAVR